MRMVLFLLALTGFLGTATVTAHATIVLGHLEVLPARPAANAPFTLQLRLEDPTQVPVQDAVVFADLRPAKTPNAAATRAEFRETEVPGTYESTLTLQPGAYSILLRDQTYRQEEAQAALAKSLRVGGTNSAQDFNFPPTATGSAGWRTWLLWLLGLPIVAALLVTVLVLTRGDDKTVPSDSEASTSTSGKAS